MEMHLLLYGGKCACGVRAEKVQRADMGWTTDDARVTCPLCRSVLAGHGRVTEPCPVQHGGTVCQGQRGVEAGEGPNVGRFRITCNRCGYSAPWRDNVAYAVSTWDALAGMLRQDYDLRNAVRRFFTAGKMTRKEWVALRGSILDMLGVSPEARRSAVEFIPAEEPTEPKPRGADTVDAVARDSIARLDLLVGQLRKDMRKDIDEGLRGTNARMAGHSDGLRARMTDIAQQVKDLRAGTNEALGVLGDRIRALSARMDGMADGIVQAAKALPKACSKCGAIHNGFASPSAVMCNACCMID